MQTIPRYLGMTILTKYPSNCYFGLMKTQISWIVCDRDSSNSWIFCNLEIVKTGLMMAQSTDTEMDSNLPTLVDKKTNIHVKCN